MQASDLGREWRAVAALGGRPIAGKACAALRCARRWVMEAGISFQLRQDHQDLPGGGGWGEGLRGQRRRGRGRVGRTCAGAALSWVRTY